MNAEKTGKNEKSSNAIKVRPEAIRIRKDDLFTNARSDFPQEPLESLKKSIRELGLLKPLTVERDTENPDQFILIAGERRHLVITILKQENHPCRSPEDELSEEASIVYDYVDVKVVKPKDDLERLQIMIAENAEHAQVPDWDYFQYALRLDKQLDEFGNNKYSRKDLCQIFNASAAWISHTLSLAKLPERIQICLKNGSLPRTAAVQLLSAKDDRIEEVLAYAENIVVRTATKEKENAIEEQEIAETEIEIYQKKEESASSIGDRINAKIWQKRGNDAKKKISVAQHREEKADNVIAKPSITDEAIKLTYEECPETVKEGIAPKVRSPKRMRSKISDLKNLLESNPDNDYIVNPITGRKYPTDDLYILIAANEQWLGTQPIDPFDLLDEEYAAREFRKLKETAW